MSHTRYYVLDTLRGFALINMILYHAIWDLVYVFRFDWSWYRSNGAYIWQQYICWTFILLSGFCFAFGKSKYKRGIIVFVCGFLITLCTCIFMPENRVVFGILTLIGSCMILMTPLKTKLSQMNPFLGAFVSFGLFVITRNVNIKFLGFESWNIISLPESLYQNLFTAYLGFPRNNFYSTDYFSIFPWIFLFSTGFFLSLIFKKQNWLSVLKPRLCKPLEWLGQHSLPIYVLHQPIIYGVLTLIFMN